MNPSRPVLPADSPSPPPWLSFLAEEEWRAFCELVELCHGAGIDILLGGALGLAAYMPLRRGTKDLDFYIRPGDREAMVALLAKAGFRDLHPTQPYDRGWIYRGLRGEVIADVIWAFPNRLTQVDEAWFIHSRSAPFGSMRLRIVPPEELIWAKLFIIQRDRCDWPDLLNLIHHAGPTLDWKRLRGRLGPNTPVLDSLLGLYRWLCPEETPSCRIDRVRLLDTRDWFLPQPELP